MSGTSHKPESAVLKRILFVDDEPNVLCGLRNMLRSERHQWEMVFALGGTEALGKLAEQVFDVVVSDLQMPQMDGAQLLTEVKRIQPRAVRIILTGQTAQEAALKSVFVAHMFLSKPCESDLLKKTVDRACHLNSILNSDELRTAAGRVDMLPAVPKTYVALNEALIRPNCTTVDVARIIERDVGVCAKILQLVNSAYFGLPRRITSLIEAVNYIGTLTIKNLAMALEAFSSASGSCGLTNTELSALQDHSLLAGQIARRIDYREKGEPEESFLAGVLHEVGWLVAVQVSEKAEGTPPVDRALLGAYLLGLWGLPHPITEAVAYHRAPQLIPHSLFELVDRLYVSHHLAKEQMGSLDSEGMNLNYLQSIGVGKKELEQMRRVAMQLAGKSAE